MKEIISKSLKLYGKCIVGSIMCFILVITLNVIGTGFFTENVGYKAYGAKDNSQERVELYTHYFADGEDTKKQEYIDNGYEVSEINIRSQMSKKTALAWDIFSEILLIFMMGVFVYNDMWKLGFKDNNSVKIGVKAENKLKGLLIGFLTALPAFILLTAVLIGKSTFAKDVSIAVYAFLNPHLYEAIITLTNGGGYISEIVPWQFALLYALLLIIPLIAHFAYILGYKSILVSEKLIYKNNQEK